MNHFERLLAAVLVLCMALSLCACGNAEDNSAATTEPAATEIVEVTEAVQETEAQEETLPEGMTVYTVTVVDEAGSPISGAMVQICLDSCYPGITDENGVATFTVAEADYKASILSMPAGYTYSTEEEAFYYEAGSTNVTITLKAEG